jgi:uncharacterized protein (TIGR02246 family)
MRSVRLATFPVAAFAVVCLAVAGAEKEKPQERRSAPPRPANRADAKRLDGSKKQSFPPAGPEEQKAVNESAKAFADAFNRHDAQSIGEGFTAEGEFVTEAGEVLRGRAAIIEHFKKLFALAPESRIGLRIDSIQTIAPAVVMEEGLVESAAGPEEAPEYSRYVAIHVRQEGGWKVARSRDFPAEAQPSAGHDHLKPLEFLLGDWMGEGEGVLTRSTFHWDEFHNFLIQDFTLRMAGRVTIKGTTRIGWDPQSKQLRSWTFDSQGGFSEARWTRLGDAWVLKTEGVTAQGRTSSATTILRKVDATTLSWESRDRMEGDISSENVPPLIVKRRPPAPME